VSGPFSRGVFRGRRDAFLFVLDELSECFGWGPVAEAAPRPALPADYLVKYQYSGRKVSSGLNSTFASLLDTACTT
jgi:hypothetical protein